MNGKTSQILALVLFGVRLFTATVLAFGAFIGYPNDPMVCGVFWTFTALSVMTSGVQW